MANAIFRHLSDIIDAVLSSYYINIKTANRCRHKDHFHPPNACQVSIQKPENGVEMEAREKFYHATGVTYI